MANPFLPEGMARGIFAAAYLNKVPRFEIYPDEKEPSKYRWRIWMSSDIVGASTQGYSTRALCLDNVKKLGLHIAELEKTGKLI